MSSSVFILGLVNSSLEGVSSDTSYYPLILNQQAYKNEETKLSVMGDAGKQQENLIPQPKEPDKPS